MKKRKGDVAFARKVNSPYFAKAVLLLIDNRAMKRALVKIRRATFQRDVDAHSDCRRCGEFQHTDDGLDPTEFCNLCAQSIVVEVYRIAAAATKPPKRTAAGARP